MISQGHSDRDERPWMAGATGLQQQHRVARIGGEAVGDGGTGGSRADDDVIVGLHVPPATSATSLAE